ncbi:MULTISPECIES: DUF4142 domain-containing protein [unclassified Rhizobium]|uniref:DUF4142 domain-containing protein n=1 Tax=unclassified Rhizobium TaxID=2613769 RepID=UPI001ADC59B3|nr:MULTISPECIES: DUF4142 domain-containing protein [unclassified Rhizobium]MBO9099387.1 DUF4142 domain-containing protein [Rhizobium sp. L58/93]MBO9188124.1 DUF4142 domain-containing protein [Rhizobium sp. E27B/91]QXZ82355.1 DUF4142 domain-containing protein [Rhizobium sp. K1/93]QXZ90132.1 DUF4142 domain-containing protein [Rhizobium sp. K15/93]QYA02669.1 DUF4142 domain-containing protein [Rhizobium sp. B21/90]
MKKSLFVGAAVLLCSFGLHSSVSAQETTVSFCKPGYTTEQTPTELAICNDPSGRTELYISSALALMNDENVSSSDRKRFLKEQDNWYDFLSSLCKSSDLSCIEASAKKRLQTVQGRVLAAVANSTSTGKKNADTDAKTGIDTMQDSSSEPNIPDMPDMIDVATLMPHFNGPPKSDLTPDDSALLTLIASINEGAIRLGNLELALDKSGQIQDMAKNMVNDHSAINEGLKERFDPKDKPNDKTMWVRKHVDDAKSKLTGLMKSPKSFEQAYLVGEFGFHSGLVTYLDSLTTANLSPEVEDFRVSTVKVLTEHRDMAKTIAKAYQISLKQ